MTPPIYLKPDPSETSFTRRKLLDSTLTYPEEHPAGHIILAHEIAHAIRSRDPSWSLREWDTAEVLEEEKGAWRLAANWLRGSGEWTPAAKDFAITCLATYYLENSPHKSVKAAIKRARSFINSL